MTQKTLNELQRITKRYSKYGVVLPDLIKLVDEAPAEITENAAITGIRMMLGEYYNETEYFTIDDIAECTGETPEEIERQMKELNIDPLYITSTIPGLFS